MLALEGNVVAFIIILYILWSILLPGICSTERVCKDVRNNISVVCANTDFKVKSVK